MGQLIRLCACARALFGVTLAILELIADIVLMLPVCTALALVLRGTNMNSGSFLGSITGCVSCGYSAALAIHLDASRAAILARWLPRTALQYGAVREFSSVAVFQP